MIVWEDSSSHLLLNPAYSKGEQDSLQKILQEGSAWPGHLWLATSGSTSLKWVGLSKQAVLASAESVNRYLASDAQDVWVNPLPTFHVGGLGIVARAYLSGAQLHDYRATHPGKWQAEDFYRYLCEKQATLTALVPAQLHDLVRLGLSSPSHVRAVIIGGGAFPPPLFEQGLSLDWPLLPSYGMTECASQAATATFETRPKLKLLPHLQCRVEEGRLAFSGPSLLTTYAYLQEGKLRFIDPKVDGWFLSEDRGCIDKGILTMEGRADASYKIGGENVDMGQLENRLQTLKFQLGLKADVTLFAQADARLGHTLHLASDCTSEGELQPLIEAFHKTVLPFERIRGIHLVKELPRSPLGKILPFRQNI